MGRNKELYNQEQYCNSINTAGAMLLHGYSEYYLRISKFKNVIL